jgi:hypothetical protein
LHALLLYINDACFGAMAAGVLAAALGEEQAGVS